MVVVEDGVGVQQECEEPEVVSSVVVSDCESSVRDHYTGVYSVCSVCTPVLPHLSPPQSTLSYECLSKMAPRKSG